MHLDGGMPSGQAINLESLSAVKVPMKGVSLLCKIQKIGFMEQASDKPRMLTPTAQFSEQDSSPAL